MSGSLPSHEKQLAATETSSLNPSQMEGAAATNCGTDNPISTLAINMNDLVFDLQMVVDGFTQCRKDDGQLHMDGYLRTYSEINK